MGRFKVALGVIAVITSTLAGVSTAAAGTNRVCDPPGDGGADGLTLARETNGDFDGDGQTDKARIYYDPNDSWMVLTQVELANGYKTFYKSTQGVGEIATFLKIRDIDRDGDDELLVSIFPMDATGPVELYALAGCKLVRAHGTGADGQPIGLAAGPGTFFPIGLDCLSPSAAGRGVTQYRSTPDQDHVVYTVERSEYRLLVDDAGQDAILKPTRTTTTALSELKPAHAAMLDHAFTFNCGPAPKCDGKRVTIQGTPFKDKVVGTAGRDIVAAGGGNDVIATKGKADLICAGGGHDRVAAGAGADKVLGQGGRDTMNGGRGNDWLDGGPGKDTANGGPGVDTCMAETKQSC